MNTLSLIARQIRVRHWTKNAIVFAPLFFAGSFFGPQLINVVYAFLSFCFTASAVYIFNDIIDKEEDALHPNKKNRPIARGDITVRVGYTLLALFLGAGIFMSYLSGISLWIGVYVLTNIFYSLRLKSYALLDALTISFLFVVRILGGGGAGGVPVSEWLVITTISLSLFLAFAKRKAEFSREYRRASLGGYSPELINQVLSASLAMSVLSYALWAGFASPSAYLIFSVFFVLLGMMRYLALADDAHQTETPEYALTHDTILLFSVLMWALYCGVVLYGEVVVTFISQLL